MAQNPQQRSPLRSVAIPAEHGGWSLTAEPVVLGLLVAPSQAGFLMGAFAILAFLARTPARIVAVDMRHRRFLHRTRLAITVLLCEATLLTAIFVAMLALASPTFLIPLVLSVPFFGIAFFYDVRHRARHLVPELLGAIGVGSFAPALALSSGEVSARVSASLWVVLALRSLLAIPYVRLQLARAKRQTEFVHTRVNFVSQMFVAAVAFPLEYFNVIPLLSACVLVLVAIAQHALARTAPPRAAIIGVQQVFIGIVVVAATALAV